MIAKQKKQRLEQIKKLENYQLSSLTCLKINLYENRSFLRDNELLDTCSILTQCPNITYLSLDFSKRDITLQQMKQLGPFISQCTQLLGLHLNFYSNRICSETAQILGSAVMRLQNLQKLKINLCCQYIQNEGMEGLIQSFSSDINTLSLKLEYISDKGLIMLGKGLLKCHKLKQLRLHMSDNFQEHEGIIIGLFIDISKLDFLSKLELALMGYQLGDQGAISICQALANCQNLLTLKLFLNQNNIGQNGAQGIGFALKSFKKLVSLSLYLCDNQIDFLGANLLYSQLFQCKTLYGLYLDLARNNLYDLEVIKNSFQHLMQSNLEEQEKICHMLEKDFTFLRVFERKFKKLKKLLFCQIQV